MTDPKTKLGQSLFQDTFFVACAQETPYRRLRQLDLEIKSLQDSIVQYHFTFRRDDVKRRRLEAELEGADEFRKEEIAIDLDQMNWEHLNARRLLADAEERLANFDEMRAQLISQVPKEYWDIGFEGAEQAHWETRLIKQISLSQAIGIPDKGAIDMLMLMPPESRANVLIGVEHQKLQLVNEQKAALALADESNKE